MRRARIESYRAIGRVAAGFVNDGRDLREARSFWCLLAIQMPMAIRVLLCSLLLMATPTSAQTSGASLLIQPDARVAAMGGAGIAAAMSGATALWWNPAQMADEEGLDVRAAMSQLVPGITKDVYQGHLSGSMRVTDLIVVGSGTTVLNYGAVVETDPFGNPTGNFSPYEVAYVQGAAFRVLPAMSLGLTVKHSVLDLVPGSSLGKGSAYAFDAGWLFRLPVAGWRFSIGSVLADVGRDYRFEDGSRSRLPTRIRHGFALESPEMNRGGIHVSNAWVLNGTVPLDDRAASVFNAGTEFRVAVSGGTAAALRAGYVLDRRGGVLGLTYGAGFELASALTLDIAWVPQAEGSGMPDALRISGGVSLGPR